MKMRIAYYDFLGYYIYEEEMRVIKTRPGQYVSLLPWNQPDNAYHAMISEPYL